MLATEGGPTDPANAAKGSTWPVVFSSRGGSRIHAWGGAIYLYGNVLDYQTLYTYDVASGAWSSQAINAKDG